MRTNLDPTGGQHKSSSREAEDRCGAEVDIGGRQGADRSVSPRCWRHDGRIHKGDGDMRIRSDFRERQLQGAEVDVGVGGALPCWGVLRRPRRRQQSRWPQYSAVDTATRSVVITVHDGRAGVP